MSGRAEVYKPSWYSTRICPHTTFLLAPGVVADLALRILGLEASLRIASSDVSALAADLERPAFGSVVDEYHAGLAQRLRRIVVALDQAQAPR